MGAVILPISQMRKARPKVIISGQGRIRTRSAYRELPRPSEGGVCVWGTGRGNPLGVQRLGPAPTAAGRLAFWGGRIFWPRACPLLSYFPSDSESPLLSQPPGTFGSLLVCAFLPLVCASGFRGDQALQSQPHALQQLRSLCLPSSLLLD